MQLFSSERSDERRAKVADELRGVIREAESLLRGDGNASSSAFGDMRARLDASLAAARRSLGADDGLLSRSREAAQSADDFIHEHAWSTVGVGALAGLVLGLLIAKR